MCDCFDLVHLENSQIGLPTVEPEQGIVVRAEVSWQASSEECVIEHPTYGRAVNVAEVDTEANDSPRELVHDDHDPMRL